MLELQQCFGNAKIPWAHNNLIRPAPTKNYFFAISVNFYFTQQLVYDIISANRPLSAPSFNTIENINRSCQTLIPPLWNAKSAKNSTIFRALFLSNEKIIILLYWLSPVLGDLPLILLHSCSYSPLSLEWHVGGATSKHFHSFSSPDRKSPVERRSRSDDSLHNYVMLHICSCVSFSWAFSSLSCRATRPNEAHTVLGSPGPRSSGPPGPRVPGSPGPRFPGPLFIVSRLQDTQ